MSIRKIAQLGEPILRQQARPLELSDLKTPRIVDLIHDLIDTMRDSDGVGLAAPQVYESLRLCVIEAQANPRYPGTATIPLTVLVNPIVTPIIESTSNSFEPKEMIHVYEGCLSVTGLRGRVTRRRRVRVNAFDASGRALDSIWEGFAAVVVQHETDHLNGTLFIDHVQPKTLTFLREFERHVPISERVIDGSSPSSL
jgi:peptide deformylase